MPRPTLEPLSDLAILIRFPQQLDPTLNRLVQRLGRSLRKDPLPGIVDIVPAYATLCICFDPRSAAASKDDLSALYAVLQERLARLEQLDEPPPRRLSLRVCYGGSDGPDLAEVADHAGLSPEELVLRHTAVEYCVGLLGFQPGFPYLLGLDAKLAAPRRSTPRMRVPAGSLAIAGQQTGIYPRESPGGWRLIGRTRAVLFDAQADPPTLFQPGDRVRFLPVSAAELSERGAEVIIE